MQSLHSRGRQQWRQIQANSKLHLLLLDLDKSHLKILLVITFPHWFVLPLWSALAMFSTSAIALHLQKVIAAHRKKAVIGCIFCEDGWKHCQANL